MVRRTFITTSTKGHRCEKCRNIIIDARESSVDYAENTRIFKGAPRVTMIIILHILQLAQIISTAHFTIVLL